MKESMIVSLSARVPGGSRLRYETLYCMLSGDTGNPDFPARSAQRKIYCGCLLTPDSRKVGRSSPGRYIGSYRDVFNWRFFAVDNLLRFRVLRLRNLRGRRTLRSLRRLGNRTFHRRGRRCRCCGAWPGDNASSRWRCRCLGGTAGCSRRKYYYF